MQCHSVLCSTILHHLLLQYAVGSVCAAGSLDLIAPSLGPQYLWDSIRSISRTLQSVKLTQNYILAAQLPPSTHRSEDTRTVVTLVIAWVLSCCSFVSLHTVLYRVYRAVLAWKNTVKKKDMFLRRQVKFFFSQRSNKKNKKYMHLLSIFIVCNICIFTYCTMYIQYVVLRNNSFKN